MIDVRIRCCYHSPMVSDNNSTRPYRPSSTVFPEPPLPPSEDPLATVAAKGELLSVVEVRVP